MPKITETAKAKKTKAVKKPVVKSVSAKVSEPAVPAKSKKVLKAEAKAAAASTIISKSELISQFATKEGDTGSPEVQVAIATHKILNLTDHLEHNPKDNHSRRGLLKVISKRRRILNYLQEKDAGRFSVLSKKLQLK